MDACEQTPAWSLSPACSSWEPLLFRESAPSATCLQNQLSFCVSLRNKNWALWAGSKGVEEGRSYPPYLLI